MMLENPAHVSGTNDVLMTNDRKGKGTVRPILVCKVQRASDIFMS